MEWTAEAIDHLRMLWGEGHSTAEIGRRMGISKNAVVGKAHRLNLPARPSPIRREGVDPGLARAALPRRAPAAAAPRPATPAPPPRRMEPAIPAAANAPAAAAAAAPHPPQPAAAAFAPRPAAPVPAAAAPRPSGGSVVRPFPRASARSCAWPMGEPGTPGFRFCGCDAMPAKPYCAEHAAIAYVKVRDRREDAA